jgi:regulator of nucleoside diphosphate kinase
MQQTKQQLVLRKDDYDVLLSCLRGSYAKAAFNRQNIEQLEGELKRAKLVSKDEFPPDVVRLNSKVKIKEADKEKLMELMLVTPEKADIKERKISIMAPMGTALIGFRQGQKVVWQVPSGRKEFIIVEVINEAP